LRIVPAADSRRAQRASRCALAADLLGTAGLVFLAVMLLVGLAASRLEGLPQFFAMGGVYLLGATGLLVPGIRWSRSTDLLGFKRPWRSLLVGACFYLLCLAPLLYLSSLYREYLLDPSHRDALQSTAKAIEEAQEPWQVWSMGLVLVLLVPLFEEILYRGFLLNGLRGILERVLGERASALLSVVGSALLFTLVHEPFTWGMVFLLGLLLGGLYVRTRNLLAPIAFHACHNAWTVIALRQHLF